MALKAVYYLIEKRLKQGLSYPEIDFNLNEHNDNSNAILQAKPSNNSNNSLFSNNNTNTINSAKISNSNSNNGVTKQSSQLLPKRHSTVQLMPRSGSQKNVDFKSIFNNTSFIESRLKLDLDTFKMKFNAIFWNSIWYFVIKGLPYDFFMPYYSPPAAAEEACFPAPSLCVQNIRLSYIKDIETDCSRLSFDECEPKFLIDKKSIKSK